MSENIKDKVSKYYTDKFLEFGETPKGVDWNSEESQALRFKQLCKVLPRDGSFSVLDYGCGYGALHDYINTKHGTFEYTGYDISAEMIQAAMLRVSGDHVNWLSGEADFKVYDFTIASGIFNVRMNFSNEEWLAYILSVLEKINTISTNGFSFNILTSYSDAEYMKDYLYYADPCYFFDYCKKHFSSQVALLHDYKLYEFSILVRK